MRSVFLLLLFGALMAQPVPAQNWELSKNKNGIKIFTATEPGNQIKSYKGEMIVYATPEKVFSMLEDVNHTDWWDKNITSMKVLKYEKNKMAQYYLVYELPWPLTSRDICVEVKVTIDGSTGIRKILAKPLPDLFPASKDLIRIRKYYQSWTVVPTGTATCKVFLEGFADPGGSVPDWLLNMRIVDSPFQLMSEVKNRMENPGSVRKSGD